MSNDIMHCWSDVVQAKEELLHNIKNIIGAGRSVLTKAQLHA